jgi:predicted acyl esterase
MKIVEQPPGRIRVIEHLLIPLGDGCRLAARVWLATDA